MTVSSPSRLPTDDVRWVATQVGRSPSLHNSQPWRLRWDGSRFRLYADSSRRLAVSDPHGRELTISCGAALFSLRAALQQLGRDGDVVLLPDPNEPELLAEVEVLAVPRPGPHVRRMPAAFMRRHTHRAGTEGGPLDRTLAWHLLAAAEAEGARLIYITAPGPLRAVLDLAHMTEWSASADAGVQQETRNWTSVPGGERRDFDPALPADVAAFRGRADGGRNAAPAGGRLPRGGGSLAAILPGVYRYDSTVGPGDIGSLARAVDPTAPGGGEHLNFDVILRRCGHAWMLMLNELGGFGSGVIVPRLEVDYHREVGLGDLAIEVVVVQVGRTSFRLRLHVLQAERLAARVEVVLVVFDYERKTPMPLTAEQRQALARHAA